MNFKLVVLFAAQAAALALQSKPILNPDTLVIEVPGSHTNQKRGTCDNHEVCLKKMEKRRHRVEASAFCSTYIQSTVTRTVYTVSTTRATTTIAPLITATNVKLVFGTKTTGTTTVTMAAALPNKQTKRDGSVPIPIWIPNACDSAKIREACSCLIASPSPAAQTTVTVVTATTTVLDTKTLPAKSTTVIKTSTSFVNVAATQTVLVAQAASTQQTSTTQSSSKPQTTSKTQTGSTTQTSSSQTTSTSQTSSKPSTTLTSQTSSASQATSTSKTTSSAARTSTTSLVQPSSTTKSTSTSRAGVAPESRYPVQNSMVSQSTSVSSVTTVSQPTSVTTSKSVSSAQTTSTAVSQTTSAAASTSAATSTSAGSVQTTLATLASPVSQTTSTQTTSSAQATSTGSTCGLVGCSNGDLLIESNQDITTLADCQAHCQQNPSCVSFQFSVSSHINCNLASVSATALNSPYSSMFPQCQQSQLYDRNCVV